MGVDAETARPTQTATPEHRRGRALTVVVAVMALVVLVAEIGVRAAAPKLRDPLLWPDWEAQHKVAAMDALAARGGASVVFVGSSMVNAGANPALASRLLSQRRPAFNASLNGSDMFTTDMWARKVVVPRLHPKVVVIGFSSGELNANWEEPGLQRRFLQSPYGKHVAKGGLLNRAEVWLIEHSYLIRYRSLFRTPVDALFGEDRADVNGRVDGFGRLIALDKYQDRAYTRGLTRDLGVWDTVFENYHPGGYQFEALDRLVDDLTSQNIRVVLVRMPVTKDVVPLHPNGEADRDAFGRALARFVTAHPVTFFDAESAVGDSPDLYVDPLHLNNIGMDRATEAIVKHVKTLL